MYTLYFRRRGLMERRVVLSKDPGHLYCYDGRTLVYGERYFRKGMEARVGDPVDMAYTMPGIVLTVVPVFGTIYPLFFLASETDAR